MTSIFIRTNCNGTLGHLARMRHLSRSLEARHYQPRFLLDHRPASSAIGWIAELEIDTVYETTGYTGSAETEQNLIDQLTDADRCIKHFSTFSPALVIVDDYRLDFHWESRVRAAGYPVLAMDDLMRRHVCDILVEPKYTTTPDTRDHPASCRLLQGPEYVLLDPAYHAVPAGSAETQPNNRHRILLSLGGGGDLRILIALMDEILKLREHDLSSEHTLEIELCPVVGPLALGHETLLEWSPSRTDAVRPIIGATHLATEMTQCDLFVGAAGTSIYETAACGLPAITFSLAENQTNLHQELEALGHYLHLNDFSIDDCSKLAGLVHQMRLQPDRMADLRQSARVTIDGRGALRITSAIDALLTSNTATNHSAQHRLENPSERTEGLRLLSPTCLGQNDGTGGDCTVGCHSFRRCTDHDINRYLDARNLPANRSNMASDSRIDRLTHYRWWFDSVRTSFHVDKDDQTELFIWHEKIEVNGSHALIGGWFVTEALSGFATVISALDWQLDYTNKQYPGIPWLAIIKKTNTFVLKMNLRAGFLLATQGTAMHQAVRAAFPSAETELFHFVYYERPASDDCHTDYLGEPTLRRYNNTTEQDK